MRAGLAGLTGQFYVPVVDEDKVAVLAKLGSVELLDHKTSSGKADEFRSVEAIRVVKGSGAVDDCDARDGISSVNLSRTGTVFATYS